MIIIRALLLQLLCGIGSGLIAYIKRRTPWSWCILGILLGPIALVLLLLLPGTSGKDATACPHCGNLIKKGAKECPHCHNNMPEDIELSRDDYAIS